MVLVKVGETLSGFKVISVKNIPEYKATGIRLEHITTGCDVFQLFNDDKENLFSFTFKTPPKNNCGTAHIIEHSVLSGSRNFPVKDPFLALMRGSLNTFLNAMTYPDKTIYPAASTLEKDYFNLMKVYGDSVFFPLLKKEIFQQEGRRFELGNNGHLTAEGIVYNEMKGAYSAHDSIEGSWSYRSLFPDSQYYFDSGGEPKDILNLTYSDFLEFHKIYYHPSNCKIFLYGNISLEKQLCFLEKNFLSNFKSKKIDASISNQKQWKAPKYLEKTSPISDSDKNYGKTSITINWKTCSVTSPLEVQSMEVLAEILLGNAGAPIHRAIVESGFGEDISPSSGIESDLKELVLTIGIRGTDSDKRDAFENLIISELIKLKTEGIPEDLLNGALKSVEFRNREIKGGVPFGLRLMEKSLRGWLHGSLPETTMEFLQPFKELKEKAFTDKRYFESLINRQLISNPHRITLIVKPDPEHNRREEDWLLEKIKSIEGKLTEKDVELLKKENEAFKEFQETPDDIKDINKIPSLKLKDLPREIEHITCEKKRIKDVSVYFHDLFTNGIVYIDFAFNVKNLNKELSLFLPLFSKAVCGCGFPDTPYHEVARQLSLKTGGILSFLESNELPGLKNERKDYLFFRLKTLESDVYAALELIRRMFLEADFTNTKRIKDLLLEHRNDLKSAILPMGNSIAGLRAGSRISSALAKEEIWRGMDQYLFLCDLAGDPDLTEISNTLVKLRKLIINKNSLTLNITAAGDKLDFIEKQIVDFITIFPEREDLTHTPPCIIPERDIKIESLIIPASVGYVATALPASRVDSEKHGLEVLLAHLLKTDFLWEEVRMKNGAYGVSASANGNEGIFTFTSYRDTKIVETFEAYKEGFSRIREGSVSRKTLEKAIIGTVGKDIHPLSPGEKSLINFRRNLYRITDEIRQKRRDSILCANKKDLTNTAGYLLENYNDSISVIMAGEKAVNKAASELGITNPNMVNIPL